MADMVIPRTGLPFVFDGAPTFIVRTGDLAPDRPLPAAAAVVFDVETHAAARRPVLFGAPGSWTVAVKPKTAVRVTAVRRIDAALVRKYGLQPYFATSPDGLVLLLTVGTSADQRLSGAFRYAPLSAGVSLDAGRDVSLFYARGGDPGAPLDTLLPDFFSRIRLPSMVRSAPEAGEVLGAEFGGSLAFGIDAEARYALAGTPSLDLARLHLSEHCTAGLSGAASFAAIVSGFFRVEIRNAADESGRPMPGFARAIVRRARTAELTFAADASVGVKTAPRRLPGTPPELLGALLGVNVGNWLNLLRHVDRLTGWDQLAAELDDLAFEFLNRWLGAAVTPHTARAALAKVRAVVAECDRIDATVLAVLERAFDAIADPSAANAIAQALRALADLSAWDRLPAILSPVIWTLLTRLTDGDPLGWMTGRPVADVRARAVAVLQAGEAARGSELGTVIRLVQTEFDVATLVDRVRALDTPAKLRAALHARAGAFLQRLLGPGIRAVAATRPGEALARLHAVLAAIDRFEQQAYDAVTGALAETFSLKLHAAYRRASSEETLIDLVIDTTTAEGQDLLRAAARGDFTGALDGWRRGLVRINEGRLTHDLVRSTTVGINVVGWHDGWRYQSVEQIILHADQQIVPDGGGGLTIFSTIELTKKTDRDRRRVRTKARERLQTNLLLRFLGEAHGLIAGDPGGRAYLIDAITRARVRYQLSVADTHATRTDLAYYLRLAADLGVADPGLSLETLDALLPRQGPDDYGPISARYDVRYTDQGLLRLFTQPPDEATMRRLMRQAVLTGYLAGGPGLAAQGWAYWTSAVYDRWKASPAAFVDLSALMWRPIDRSPFPERPAPEAVTLAVGRQAALGALYGVEDDFVAGFRTLTGLIGARTPMSPVAFERALGRIGAALRNLDDFAESLNASFALFDALLHRAGASRASSLTLKSLAAGREVTKVFLGTDGPGARGKGQGMRNEE